MSSSSRSDSASEQEAPALACFLTLWALLPAALGGPSPALPPQSFAVLCGTADTAPFPLHGEPAAPRPTPTHPTLPHVPYSWAAL